MLINKIIIDVAERTAQFNKAPTKLITNDKTYPRLAKMLVQAEGDDDEIIANMPLKEFMGMKVICRFGANIPNYMVE